MHCFYRHNPTALSVGTRAVGWLLASRRWCMDGLPCEEWLYSDLEPQVPAPWLSGLAEGIKMPLFLDSTAGAQGACHCFHHFQPKVKFSAPRTGLAKALSATHTQAVMHAPLCHFSHPPLPLHLSLISCWPHGRVTACCSPPLFAFPSCASPRPLLRGCLCGSLC